ncbi:Aldo/keto reductase [Hortaea werneckii]|nr:Aldo/keto reductase [Hortaea werneckii]KAI7103961.1 Aldo/keto reductase [Hortaea werneckii]KAI7242573.1 Aldo/keto reductase [Hortaea werneckii]KAI7296897.1 Aldo/keto reductase [Hortaea werneckii]KAI7377708.1 Aldo/keto reductase [Hortaea werneckii]
MANKLDINSTVSMKSGFKIPMLGYGVYQTPAADAEEVTAHAISVGYRHVDSATAYRNEQPSCAGMLKPGIPRDQLFFTSKVPPKCINYKDAKACVDESLNKTGLSYIDLYLLHAPYGGKEGRLGAWQALVESVGEGKVRSIGVSNYGVHHLQELEDWQKQQASPEKAGIVSVNQVELHPFLARPDIVSWCRQRDMVLEAYSPLSRGTRFDDPRIQSLAKKHSKTPAQILLRWNLQMGFVILPKSVTKSRIEENKDVYDFELDADDMKVLETGEYTPSTWDPTVAPLSS